MNLDGAKQLVFSKKPVLARIYNAYHSKTWLEYAREQFPTANNNFITPEFKGLFASRIDEFIPVFRKVLMPLLDQDTIEAAADSLVATRFTSTSDHHGLLCHPFFADNALLRSHPAVVAHQYAENNHKQALVSLTCGGVSLGNTSFPRGIFFHDDTLEQVRAPFISLRDRHKPVYGYPAISSDVFTREIDRINSLSLPKRAKIRYESFLRTLINTEELWDRALYSDQLTMMSEMLWDIIFGRSRGNLVYLEIETLVRQLLLDIHLSEQTIFHKFLFDKTYRDAYVTHFSGVTGAHGDKQYGSHFFWYVDNEKKARVQLWYENDELKTADKQIVIPLTPDSIRKHLKTHTILPGMAMCYSMISFYYGITLGGGFSQVQYLADMKNAYVKALEVCGDAESRASQGIRTDIFTGEYVAVGLGHDDVAVPATMIDILLYGDNSIHNIINKQFETITIGETLDLMMPEFVQIVAGSRQDIVDLQSPSHTFSVNEPKQLHTDMTGLGRSFARINDSF